MENLDIFEQYGYKQNQEVLIDSEFLIGVLSFCQRVDAQQPQLAVPMQYPKQSLPITDRETGEIVRVDTDWEEYPSAKAFANTAFSQGGAIPVMTELGLFSFQIQQALFDYHRKNIENGIAIPFKTEE
jgi:hypothetical protein